MTKGIVTAVNISEKKGEIKHSVPFVTLVEDYGIQGDAHAGPGIRQISLLGRESVDKMTALGVKGLCAGKFAENLTTEGITLYTIPVGTKLKIGDTLHEVTQIGKKCHAEQGCEVARTVGFCIMPKEGIFTKVLKGGKIQPGDVIEIIE